MMDSGYAASRWNSFTGSNSGRYLRGGNVAESGADGDS